MAGADGSRAAAMEHLEVRELQCASNYQGQQGLTCNPCHCRSLHYSSIAPPLIRCLSFPLCGAATPRAPVMSLPELHLRAVSKHEQQSGSCPPVRSPLALTLRAFKVLPQGTSLFPVQLLVHCVRTVAGVLTD